MVVREIGVAGVIAESELEDRHPGKTEAVAESAHRAGDHGAANSVRIPWSAAVGKIVLWCSAGIGS